LITANNSVLGGGDFVVNLGLFFEAVEDGYPLPEPIYFQAEFYAAEIEIDAILSYPWLRENGVGVFPHHDALAKDWPEFALLYGWHQTKTNNIPRSPRKGKEKRVRPVLALTGGGAPPSKYGHEPGRWVACDYAVRAPHVQTILDHFGLTPTRDCFANPENRRFDKWWGPGSPEGDDAFLQDWGPEHGLLWMNPLSTFSLKSWKRLEKTRHMSY
jgi:hypothetical protein